MARKKGAAQSMGGTLHEQFLIRVNRHNSIKEEKEREFLTKQLKATLNGRDLILNNSNKK